MFRKFNFDYDAENDNLFLYDPKSKSRASVEFDDVIIDFNSRKEVAGIELLNASDFFKGLKVESSTVSKALLRNIKSCKVNVAHKNNFILIKLILTFDSDKQLVTPLFIPSIKEPSPALAY